MTKSIKKLMATCMAVMSICSVTVSVTAFAANKDYSFSVVTTQNDGKAFSSGKPKDDGEQTAYVYTTSGNIASNDLFYMAVYKSPYNSASYKVTAWQPVANNNGRYLLNYNVTRSAGSINYLCGDTDRYSVSVEGHWYS